MVAPKGGAASLRAAPGDKTSGRGAASDLCAAPRRKANINCPAEGRDQGRLGEARGFMRATRRPPQPDGRGQGGGMNYH